MSTLQSVAVHAQGNPPQSCPADPVGEMNDLVTQINALESNIKVQAKLLDGNLKQA